MLSFLRTTVILSVIIWLAAMGCSDSDDSGSGGDGGMDESCIASDGSSDQDMCYMVEESYESFQFECEILGGSWFDSPCDETQFVRRCRSEVGVSVNGGAEENYHYVYYYPEGSNTYCIGDETNL